MISKPVAGIGAAAAVAAALLAAHAALPARPAATVKPAPLTGSVRPHLPAQGAPSGFAPLVGGATVLPRATLTQPAPTISVSANLGIGGSIQLQVVGNGTGGSAVSGTIHVQTTAGVIDATFQKFSVTVTTKGGAYASISALGYYQPNGGGQPVPTLLGATFATVPGSRGNGSVTLTNYYTKVVFYSSGSLGVVQGHVTAAP